MIIITAVVASQFLAGYKAYSTLYVAEQPLPWPNAKARGALRQLIAKMLAEKTKKMIPEWKIQFPASELFSLFNCN